MLKQPASEELKLLLLEQEGQHTYLEWLLAKTTLPVIGVPVQSRALNGLDSLLSIVQMPGGIPVATVAIGKAGATNAGLLAAQILSITDQGLAEKLESRREQLKEMVLESTGDLK